MSRWGFVPFTQSLFGGGPPVPHPALKSQGIREEKNTVMQRNLN